MWKLALGLVTAAAVGVGAVSPAFADTSSSDASATPQSQVIYVAPGVTATITKLQSNPDAVTPMDQTLPWEFYDNVPTNNVPWSSSHFTANSTTTCTIGEYSVTNGITSGNYDLTLYQDFASSAKEISSVQLPFGGSSSSPATYKVTWSGLTAGTGYNIQIASQASSVYIEGSGEIQ